MIRDYIFFYLLLLSHCKRLVGTPTFHPADGPIHGGPANDKGGEPNHLPQENYFYKTTLFSFYRLVAE